MHTVIVSPASVYNPSQISYKTQSGMYSNSRVDAGYWSCIKQGPTVLARSQTLQCWVSSQQAGDSYREASDSSRFKSMVDNVQAAVELKTSLSFGREILYSTKLVTNSMSMSGTPIEAHGWQQQVMKVHLLEQWITHWPGILYPFVLRSFNSQILKKLKTLYFYIQKREHTLEGLLLRLGSKFRENTT